jgi:hypothetical protein
MTEEIELMMAELTALCNKGNSLPTTRPPAPAPTTVLPKLLLKAEAMQAHSEYAGPDLRHLAYAYINEVTAVGFNTRTNLGGRFPVDSAKKVEPQPHEKAEIFFAIGSSSIYGSSSPSSLGYNTGEYVRVCRREKDVNTRRGSDAEETWRR